MIVKIERTFSKDLDKIRDGNLLQQIHDIIIECQKAKDLRFIKNLKKLSGHKTYYRIKIDEYRIGVIIKSNAIEFIRFQHRKDIYKRFP